jgi:hypothetical protein
MLLSNTIEAEIYKSVDADGNVIYSDKADSQAQSVELPQANTLPAVQVPKKTATTADKDSEDTDKDEAYTYKSVRIISPKNDEGITHGGGNLSISIKTNPKLHKDHRIRMLMDGKNVAEARTGSLQLTNIDRGSHTFQAVIVDQQDKILKRSRSITVHLFRPSVKPQGR